jgi:hypothetical protein
MILIFSIFILCTRNAAGELVFDQLYNHPSPIDVFIVSLLVIVDLITISLIASTSKTPQKIDNDESKKIQVMVSSKILLNPSQSETGSLYNVHKYIDKALEQQEARQRYLKKEVLAQEQRRKEFLNQKFPSYDFSKEQSKRKISPENKSRISRHFFLSDLLSKNIDEEGEAFIIDKTLEWEKMGLTRNQINRKEILFILDLYWGMFIVWIQIKTKAK